MKTTANDAGESVDERPAVRDDARSAAALNDASTCRRQHGELILSSSYRWVGGEAAANERGRSDCRRVGIYQNKASYIIIRTVVSANGQQGLDEKLRIKMR